MKELHSPVSAQSVCLAEGENRRGQETKIAFAKV